MWHFGTHLTIISVPIILSHPTQAWRSLPSKVVAIYEDLSAARVLLQGDHETLLKGDSYQQQPTLPPTLLFLMHLQQLEIGGFQLANGMYKWNKIK